MTTVSGTLTAVSVSSTLVVQAKGETISIALSGTYNMTVQIERALGPDEIAWEVVAGPFTTANATVAQDFTSQRRDERYRVRVTVDTSGTLTYSISDGDKEVSNLTDDLGNAIFTHTQANTTAAKRFILGAGMGHGAPVSATAATLAVTAAAHAGRTVLLDRAAGIAVTLPEASGTGNRYRFVIATTISSNTTTIKVAASTDESMVGSARGVDDDAEGATGYQWNCETNDDTVTMSGTATGGMAGDVWELEDIATDTWAIDGVLTQSGGSEVTPFSATVSS